MDNLGAIVGPLLALGLVAAGRRAQRDPAVGHPGPAGRRARSSTPSGRPRLPDRSRERRRCASRSGRCCAASSAGCMAGVHRVRGRQRRRDPADPARHRPAHPAAAGIDSRDPARARPLRGLQRGRHGRLVPRRAPVRPARRRAARWWSSSAGSRRSWSPTWCSLAPAEVVVLGVAFVLAGVGIGCAETAEPPPSPRSRPRTSAARPSGCSPPCRPAATCSPAPSPACSTPSPPTVAFVYLAAGCSSRSSCSPSRDRGDERESCHAVAVLRRRR